MSKLRSLRKDDINATKRLKIPARTVTDILADADPEGGEIAFATNAAGGATFCGFNGVNWVRLSDGVIIS